MKNKISKKKYGSKGVIGFKSTYERYQTIRRQIDMEY